MKFLKCMQNFKLIRRQSFLSLFSWLFGLNQATLKQDSGPIQNTSEVVNDTVLKYIKSVIIYFGLKTQKNNHLCTPHLFVK